MPYYIKKKHTEIPKGQRSATRSLIEKLDKAFSLYIRLRDVMPSGYFKCISCGQIKPFEQADAGHYFSRTHMSTRFHEDNVHSECRGCNRFSADHLDAYRENLIKKSGQQRFDILRVLHNQSKQWSAWELEQLTKHYRAEARRLAKEKGIKIK